MAGIGVVFSSGFFGFFAHAGFLSALRQLKIIPRGYAGASSGAIVGAMAASGMEEREIKRLLFSLRKSDFWDPDPVHLVLKKALGLFRGYTGYLRLSGFKRLLQGLPARTFEECRTPLSIIATNLTHRKETRFTRGDLIEAIVASGAIPLLFKPVRINHSFYVDGGIVNKAPVEALYHLIEPETIIVHFIPSNHIEDNPNGFLKKRVTPWHMQQLAMDISRQEAYKQQCRMARERGVEVIEVRSSAPGLGPNTLERGPVAYERARGESLRILSKVFLKQEI